MNCCATSSISSQDRSTSMCGVNVPSATACAKRARSGGAGLDLSSWKRSRLEKLAPPIRKSSIALKVTSADAAMPKLTQIPSGASRLNASPSVSPSSACTIARTRLRCRSIITPAYFFHRAFRVYGRSEKQVLDIPLNIWIFERSLYPLKKDSFGCRSV